MVTMVWSRLPPTAQMAEVNDFAVVGTVVVSTKIRSVDWHSLNVRRFRGIVSFADISHIVVDSFESCRGPDMPSY